MQINSKVTDKTIKELTKNSLIHILNHPFLYVLTAAWYLLFLYGFSFLPGALSNISKTLFGCLVTFFIVEITYASTQEKYTVKKYIASFYATSLGIKNIINKQRVILIGIGLLFILFLDSMEGSFKIAADTAKMTEEQLENQLFSTFILRFSSTGLIDIVTLSVWGSIVITDYYLLSRAFGEYNTDFYDIANDAARKNKKILLRMIMLLFIILLFTAKVSALLHIFGIVFMTLYSMDVYDIDVGKKQKQEQEEKEKAMLKEPVLN